MNIIYILVTYLLLIRQLHTLANEIPDCDFADTVNITDSQKFENGSYLYENVLIPKHLTGVYTRKLAVDGEEEYEIVPEHIRGCVCKLKSCVKFCCHPSGGILNDSMECTQGMDNVLKYSPLINVILNNGSRQLLHVFDKFAIQQLIPCDSGYTLLSQYDKDDQWELFENGTLLTLYAGITYSSNDYCLTPTEYNGSYYLNPNVCPTANTFEMISVRKKANGITVLMSIPFFITTIIVYLAIPKLRNLHGKCLICYLIGLAAGCTLQSVIFFLNMYPNNFCNALGYLSYYFFLSAFFWLSVISYDLWQHFKVTTGAIMLRKRFLYYSLYAWSTPLLMTSVTFYAQNSDLIEELKPGFGVSSCWLNVEIWSPMIYFYGPILILITVNIIMFTLVAINIYKIQKEMKSIAKQGESTVLLSTHKDNFFLFLRLFIVMGVTWLLEVFSFMAGESNAWSGLFYLPDIFNSAQGVIIFMLFVLRRKVLNLLKECFTGERNEQRSSNRSTFGTNELNLNNCGKNNIK